MANPSDATPFSGWCILELLGHRRLAGFIREETIAGKGFLRIEIPGEDGAPVATQFYSPDSVYAITPTTEAMARRVAAAAWIPPAQTWEAPPGQRRLPGPTDKEFDDE